MNTLALVSTNVLALVSTNVLGASDVVAFGSFTLMVCDLGALTVEIQECLV